MAVGEHPEAVREAIYGWVRHMTGWGEEPQLWPVAATAEAGGRLRSGTRGKAGAVSTTPRRAGTAREPRCQTTHRSGGIHKTSFRRARLIVSRTSSRQVRRVTAGHRSVTLDRSSDTSDEFRVRSSGRRNTPTLEVSHADRNRQRDIRFYRGRSRRRVDPLSPCRRTEPIWWTAIARGVLTGEAAAEAGASSPSETAYCLIGK